MSSASLRGRFVRSAVVASVVMLPLGMIGFAGEQMPHQGVLASEQLALVGNVSVMEAGPDQRAAAVQFALGKLGSPYRWGGTGPSSFDCSGLVSWAFAQAGVAVPRTSRAQSQAGSPVSRANLQPGDLVFFYSPVSHVGIYIGNGQMVHSSTSGKPVAVANIAGRPFHSARRI